MITYSFIIRKGVIIKNIQTTSGAKLITTIDDPKSDLFTGIVIMASLRNALVAHKNIYDIVQETDDLVLEFPFYEKKYKFLTGEKGFNTLRKLSADTNVRIFIPNTENSMLLDGKYSNDASFEGTYPNICKAIELIESHYKKREREPINNSLLAANPVAIATTNIHNDTSVSVAAPVQQPALVHSNSVNNNNNNHQDKNSKVAKVKGPPAKDPNDTSASVNTTNVRNPKEKLKNTTSESSEKKTPNSKNKEKSKDEPTVNTEVTEVKEVAEVKELVKLERIIEIPSNIVGIFLARPRSSNTNSSKISVVNQIQKYTRTTISLIDPPPARVKPAETTTDSVEKPVSSTTKESTNGSNEVSSRRRSDNDEESGSDDEDDNSDGLADDEEVEEEDEVEEGDDNEVDEKVEATETSNKDTIAVVSEKEIQPITMVRFTVSNQRGISRDSIDPLCTQENIDLACTVITRMINGERIKDVLAIFSSSPYKNKKGKEAGGKNVRPKKFNNSQNNDGDNKKKTHNHSNKDKSSPKKDAQNTQKEMPK